MAGDSIIQSFGSLNYSGMLFNKGNTNAPFSTMIANGARQTNSVEFVTGLEYTTGGGAQPAISETSSLTAPDATFLARAQKTNVTQIFQESVYISYGKQSNMGTLSGANLQGQAPNPLDELAFQVSARMQKIARDIEFTFMQGAYNKASTDAEINKTRGMNAAITSNALAMGGEALRVWDVADAMKLVYESNAPLTNLVLWLNATSLFQLNADAEANGLTVVPAARNINGLQVSQLLTPLGAIGVYLGEFIPSGTAFLINPTVINRVEQPVPGKGNFFMEELSKTGAGTKYQIFGQLGLDHGPEWMHAKITGINTTFTKPQAGRKVYASEAIPTVAVLPSITGVTLAAPVTVSSATDALTLTYNGTLSAAATLAYKWQICATATGTFTDIASATSATYTPAAGDATKYIRCVVTATGTAQGSKISNAVVVAAA